ncbi:putative efflux transporter [Desarmillaria tabescens]|uniref:Efflux transporter n=1 Tax=Armillaria tabescens TaxID=1929756 RepID=A0AA39TVQ2_ARMTA|nr:putative efflux transporter [Desarmillaria tabescens]KAK0467833.1 putative efflux transporter [Desarmillaria tabescens]
MSVLRSVLIVASCTLAMMVNNANQTSVSIALPTMAVDLDVPESELTWVVSAYPLSAGCLLLMFGRIADLYGRKKVYCFGALWLAVFTLGVSFANNAMTLDILRGLQGVGAAATIPASARLGILAHAFPPSRARTIAFATFAAGAPIGGAIGTAIGGVMVQLTKQTWRSLFYLNTGLTVASLALGLFTIDRDLPSTEDDQRIDVVGTFLATAGLVLIVFILTQGELAPQQWKTPYITALLITGVIFIVLFLFWQHYLERQQDSANSPSKWTPPPLMRLSLWTRANGRVAVVMVIAFLNWCCFQGWCYWTQLYYQNYEGRTPILTVVRMVPQNVSGLICNVIVAFVAGRVPFIYFMVSGTALTSAASLLFALINPTTTYWAFDFPAAVLSVVGADFVFAAGTLFIAKVSLPHEQSVAGAVFQTMTQLGTSFGVTISTVVYDRVLRARAEDFGTDSSNAPKPAQLDAYQAAAWTDFAFGIFAALLALVFFQGAGVLKEREGDADTLAVPEDDVQTEKAAKELST